MKERHDALEQIKESLLARQSEMTSQMTQQTQEKVSDGQVQDSGDEALSLSMEALQNSLQQTGLNELSLIQSALHRIESGEYGLCIDCSEQIATKRLMNFPYAARCIVCQEAFESQS